MCELRLIITLKWYLIEELRLPLLMQGDSGGPLQCRISKNGPWMLAGVTSFGSGCAEQGYPDVYSRISHYVQWIEETMLENDGETGQKRRRWGK